MPRRPYSIDVLGADGKLNPAALRDAVEHTLRGTREQYESDWTVVGASAAGTFTHLLGEIPWVVDINRSESSDGARAVDANALVTTTKSDTVIVVTNTATAAYYFKVRAM